MKLILRLPATLEILPSLLSTFQSEPADKQTEICHNLSASHNTFTSAGQHQMKYLFMRKMLRRDGSSSWLPYQVITALSQLHSTSVITNCKSKVNITLTACPLIQPVTESQHTCSHKIYIESSCSESSELIGLKISSVGLLHWRREKPTLMICVQQNE